MQAAFGIQHVWFSDCNFHLISLKSNFPWVNSVASIIIYPNKMNCTFSNKFPDIAWYSVLQLISRKVMFWMREKKSKTVQPQYNEENTQYDKDNNDTIWTYTNHPKYPSSL